MSTLRISALAATLIAAAALTTAVAVPAASATIVGHGFGSGSTSAAAKQAATNDLEDNYFGCSVPILIFDTQGSNGIWSAEVGANCQGVR
jgi:hypothetical protein